MSEPRSALLISYAYPPISAPGALRVSRFAKYLPDHNWSPTVLTVEGGYSRMMSDKDPAELPGVSVVRVADKAFKTGVAAAAAAKGNDKPSGIKGRLKGLARSLMIPDRDRTWIPMASAQAVQTAEKIGARVVFSSSPTVSNHLVAEKVAKRFGIPWVADFRDPWTVGPTYDEAAWRRRIDKGIEGRIFQNASKVLVVSEMVRSLVAEAYPQHARKVEVIYNGYDEDDFTGLSFEPIRDRYILTYAGSFYGGKRDPSGLLRAIGNLKKKGELRPDNFSFQIFGHPEDVVVRQVEELDIQDLVDMPGLLPYDECLLKLGESSAALLVTFSDPRSRGEMTTKFFEYLALRKPMLGLIPPAFELAQMMEKYKAGAAFAPQDSAGIEGWLSSAVRRHLAEGPQEAGEGDISQLSRRAGAARLAQIMDEIAR